MSLFNFLTGPQLPALPQPSVTPNNAGLFGAMQQPMQPVDPSTLATPQTPSYAHALGKLSMLDQLKMLGSNPVDTIKAAAGAVPGAVGNMLLGNTDAMDGLLSPDQKHAAEMRALQHFGISLLADRGPHVGVPAPSFAQSVAKGLLAGEDAGQGAAQSMVQQQMQMLPLQYQMRMLKARQAIGSMYAARQNETPSETRQRYLAMRDAYASIGDTESVKEIDDMLKQTPTFKGFDPYTINTGDAVHVYDKNTMQPIGVLPTGMSQDARAQHEFSQVMATANLQEHKDALNATRMQQGETNLNNTIHQYAEDTGDWQKVKEAWDLLNSAAQNPSLAQPIALIDGFGRINNPRAQVRPSMVQILSEMGTLGDQIGKWIQKNGVNGALPQAYVDAIVKQASSTMRSHRMTYREQRRAALQRAQRAGLGDISNVLPNYDVVLPGDNAPKAPTTPFGPLGDPNQ